MLLTHDNPLTPLSLPMSPSHSYVPNLNIVSVLVDNAHFAHKGAYS